MSCTNQNTSVCLLVWFFCGFVFSSSLLLRYLRSSALVNGQPNASSLKKRIDSDMFYKFLPDRLLMPDVRCSGYSNPHEIKGTARTYNVIYFTDCIQCLNIILLHCCQRLSFCVSAGPNQLAHADCGKKGRQCKNQSCSLSHQYQYPWKMI